MHVGATYRVLSNTPPNTQQAGAFFLHWLPPSLGVEPEEVFIYSTGTPQGYLRKQWGNGTVAETSFPQEFQTQQWYNSTHLKRVWTQTHVEPVDQVWDEQLLAWSSEYDYVLHSFSADRHAAGRTLVRFPCLSHRGTLEDYGPNRICYNGEHQQRWVRSTVAWGRRSLEYPVGTHVVNYDGLHDGLRGTGTISMLRDIPPDVQPVTPAEYLAPNVMPIGRYATWQRRALSHDTYAAVLGLLTGVLHESA
jgi:hypothetical protein